MNVCYSASLSELTISDKKVVKQGLKQFHESRNSVALIDALSGYMAERGLKSKDAQFRAERLVCLLYVICILICALCVVYNVQCTYYMLICCL